MVLILKETLSISSTVLPACVDWMGLKDGKYPQEDEHGKVNSQLSKFRFVVKRTQLYKNIMYTTGRRLGNGSEWKIQRSFNDH